MISRREQVNGLLQRTGHHRTYRRASKRAVLMAHGATFNVDWWFDLDVSTREVSRVIDAGFPVGSLTTLLTWGNQAILDDLSLLRSNMIASGLAKPGKVNLVGVSMGGLTVLNWARKHPELVQSITLLIPVTNVQGVWDEDRGSFKAGITAAHGGRPPDDANPLTNAGDFTRFPIQLFYSTNDAITKAAEQRTFAEWSGATLRNMGALGHFWGAPWTGHELVKFLRTIG